MVRTRNSANNRLFEDSLPLKVSSAAAGPESLLVAFSQVSVVGDDNENCPPPPHQQPGPENGHHIISPTYSSSRSAEFAARLELLTSYWNSTEAKNLFRPQEDESVQDAVNNMIDILDGATSGCKNAAVSVMEGNDKYGMCTDEDKDKLIVKALYVGKALKLARATANSGGTSFSLLRSCEQAVHALAPLSLLNCSNKVVKAGTVSNWFRQFRGQEGGRRHCFPHPKKKAIEGFQPILNFFEKDPLNRQCFTNHLKSLMWTQPDVSADYVYSYFFGVILFQAHTIRGFDDADFPSRVMTEFDLHHVNHGTFRNLALVTQGFPGCEVWSAAIKK